MISIAISFLSDLSVSGLVFFAVRPTRASAAVRIITWDGLLLEATVAVKGAARDVKSVVAEVVSFAVTLGEEDGLVLLDTVFFRFGLSIKVGLTCLFFFFFFSVAGLKAVIFLGVTGLEVVG